MTKFKRRIYRVLADYYYGRMTKLLDEALVLDAEEVFRSGLLGKYSRLKKKWCKYEGLLKK
jgi:hypothetical protein